MFYLSRDQRDRIARASGEALPRGFASPERFCLSGDIMTPLVGEAVYVDGGDIVKGDKAVLRNYASAAHTFADVAGVLDIKAAKPWLK